MNRPGTERSQTTPPQQVIVLGGSLTALAVVRNAAALGLRVVLADRGNGVASRSRDIDLQIDLAGADGNAIEWQIRSIAQDIPTLLIADSDDWLQWIRTHRSNLGASGIRVLHPDDDVLSICLDKQRFSQWCEQHGLPTAGNFPLNVNASDADLAALPYPIFVRPQTTHHSDQSTIPKAGVAASADDLRKLLEPFRRADVPVLASRSLLSPTVRQYSYGFARREDGEQCGILCEKLRPHADQYSTGSLVTTTTRPEVLAVARQAVAALGYVGIGEVELLHDDATGETNLIELNARPWLQYGLVVQAGCNLLQFHLDPASFDATRIRTDELRWLSMGIDLFNCFSRRIGLIPLGKLTMREYLKSLTGRRVWAAWSLRDPCPALNIAGWGMAGCFRTKIKAAVVQGPAPTQSPIAPTPADSVTTGPISTGPAATGPSRVADIPEPTPRMPGRSDRTHDVCLVANRVSRPAGEL